MNGKPRLKRLRVSHSLNLIARGFRGTRTRFVESLHAIIAVYFVHNCVNLPYRTSTRFVPLVITINRIFFIRIYFAPYGGGRNKMPLLNKHVTILLLR